MRNFSDNNMKDDMSMEDILASIRKYVSAEELEANKTPQKSSTPIIEDEEIVNLSQDHIAISDEQPNIEIQNNQMQDDTEHEETYQQVEMNVTNETEPQHGISGSFSKLASALKSYGSSKKQEILQPQTTASKTIDQFFEDLARPLIQSWIDNNMEQIVEKIINKEIEKLKSDI